jgi:hypothetical protein
LSFPASEILEQWKKDNPSPTVGKKAKVKWANAIFRKYPSARGARMGHFNRNDEVAVLSDLSNGWSLVQSRKPDGKGDCFGFIRNRALATPDVPDPPEWSAPLAQVRLNPGEKLDKDPVVETPAHYCQRTAWTPELFAMEVQKAHPLRAPGSADQLVAIR